VHLIPASPGAFAVEVPSFTFRERWKTAVLALMPHWVEFQLSCWQWGRKFLGGRWEKWIVSGFTTYLWIAVEEWSHVTGLRPLSSCHGTPVCEEDGVTLGIPRILPTPAVYEGRVVVKWLSGAREGYTTIYGNDRPKRKR
jgi:hypothetical protein